MAARAATRGVSVAFLLLAVCIANPVDALPPTVKIGGLFSAMEKEIQTVFRMAVAAVNQDSSVLPEARLVAQTSEVPEYDSYHTGLTVCELMTTGVAGIFGPTSSFTAGHVQSICDTMEIPHIQTLYDAYLRRETCSINLHPHPSTISDILVRLVEVYKWSKFTVLYEDEDGLVRLNGLLKLYDPKGHTVTVRQLPEGEDMKPVFRQILNEQTFHIVLDCNIDRLPDVLLQLQQIGLMGSTFSYIITNLDFATLDLEQYRYSGTNITGLRLVDPTNPLVLDAVEQWLAAAAREGQTLDLEPRNVKLDMALAWDAVWLFARSLDMLDSSKDVDVAQLNCEDQKNWEHGFSLINFMRTNEMQGLTGPIKFDYQGFRTDFSLDIVEMRDEGDGIQKIGNVDMRSLNLTRIEMARETQRKELEAVQNQTFIVLIALSEPYNMLVDSSNQLSGNDRYEGFCIDLIKDLAALLGFNYTFVLQPDNEYGSCHNDTTKCYGMIKGIVEGTAHLAITDLTITFDRAKYVDFTKPFMNLGIGLLFRKPRKMPPSLFSFLSPFSNEVWMYLMGAYVLVSVELYIMARITPDEWNNPYPCIEEPEELSNQFSMLNALWFTIGSLMQQGSEIAPIAVSTRMVAGVWWFFTLIMVSSYTANLAAFLTVESVDTPIKSVEDLAKQNVIKYGAKKSGSTRSFFKDSNNSLYSYMYEQMLKDETVFTSSNSEGITKVESTDYAFFMESASIKYHQERNCNITQVGKELDQKGYGIAIKKNAPYLSAISAGVVKLQESGRLQDLYTRWWEQRKGGGACSEANTSNGGADELGLDNVGGVFLVLVTGVALAILFAIAELVWELGRKAMKEKVSFRQELWEEVRFILKCHGSTKPVKKPKSEEEELEEALKDFQPLSPYATDLSGPGPNSNGDNNGDNENYQKEPLY